MQTMQTMHHKINIPVYALTHPTEFISEDKQFTIKNYNLKNAIVGLISGLTVDIIMNPLRVLKTNYQTTNKIRINFKDIKFIDRGLKLRLLLSCLQSSFFNMFILWK